jgi:cathepsin A (carboxypeptidase C)
MTHTKLELLIASAALLTTHHALADRRWTYKGSDFLGSLSSPTVDEGLEGICGDTNQTAGYFDITGSKDLHYFYWFFESRNDPATDPVVLWMTGGPGCSSAVALFHENGPCKINDDHKTTRINPYGWNQNASMIFIDQPAGVGFSYGDSSDDVDDEKGVAEDMYHFLHEFFDANPKYRDNDFFVFGESYGGHFAPATARRVGTSLNLKGLAVGNGLTNPLVQYKYYPELAYNYSMAYQGHPTVELETWKAMEEAVPSCVDSIARCEREGGDSCATSQALCNGAEMQPYQETGLNPYDIREKCKVPPLCYDFTDVKTFLGQPHVLDALGVRPGIEWQSCNFTVNAAFQDDWMQSYADAVPPLLANGTRVMIYAGDVDFICNWLGNRAWTLELDWPGKDAFNAEGEHLWTGATLPACPKKLEKRNGSDKCDAGDVLCLDKDGTLLYPANSGCGASDCNPQWAQCLNVDVEGFDWGTETLTKRNQAAGRARTHGGLTFLQVHNAGHMVPLDQPANALDMLNTFTSGKAFYPASTREAPVAVESM